MSCKICYERSFASFDKAFFINRTMILSKKLLLPRMISKWYGKLKYPFVCEKGHWFDVHICKITHRHHWCNNNICKQEKHKQTCIKNYGVDHPMKSEEVQEKHKQTCIKNYGVDHPMKSEEVQEKHKQSCIKNYGVDHPMKSQEVQEKSKQTCIKNYGVDHPMKNPEIFIKNQQSSFAIKEFIFPSGKIVYVQGNEPWALDWLFDHYKDENVIQTHSENHMTIPYNIDSNNHVYYPDLYIPSENMIIEVKSEYTYKYNEEIDKIKAQACIRQGYK
jgi:hypothetical protein